MRFIKEGIPVRKGGNAQYHMHHKFAVVDGRLLLSGSYPTFPFVRPVIDGEASAAASRLMPVAYFGFCAAVDHHRFVQLDTGRRTEQSRERSCSDGCCHRRCFRQVGSER